MNIHESFTYCSKKSYDIRIFIIFKYLLNNDKDLSILIHWDFFFFKSKFLNVNFSKFNSGICFIF